MGKPETAYKKKDARKSPVGLVAVGKCNTIRSLNEKKASTVELAFSSFYLFRVSGLTNAIITTVLLIFVVIAPLFIEQLKIIPAIWNYIADLLAKIGLLSR